MTTPARGRLRPAMSEAQFQGAVVDLATLFRCRTMHIHDSRRGLGAGYPDLTVLHRDTGRLLFSELKIDTGRVSLDQQGWINNLLLGGHPVYVWRPADLRSGLIEKKLRELGRDLPR